MRKIIDNEPTKYALDKYTMANAIKEIIDTRNPSNLDIASGEFKLNGWQLIDNSLLKIKYCRLIFGWEFKNAKNVENEVQEWFNSQIDEVPLDDYSKTRSYVRSLIAFLKREDPVWKELSDEEKTLHPDQKYLTQVKLYTNPHLHGKLYLFPDIAIVGSSNFTSGGLTGNTELNVVEDSKEGVDALKQWFDHFFYSKKAWDYREKLVELLEGSRFGNKEYDPYTVYLKIIFEYHKHELRKELEGDKVVKLAAFQEEGANRALFIIDEFGGVMIADAVGLGKSYMGAHILRTLGLRAPPMENMMLVVCPANLKSNWEKILENAGLHSATIVSQELLSRDLEKIGYGTKAYDLVLVDESHNFRRPKPKRYSNLMNILTRKNPKVVLLTATPINIGYMDLYYQLMLIFKNRDQALSSILDIQSLKDYIAGCEKGTGQDINLLIDHLLVARSRSVIRYRQKVLKQDIYLPNGKKIEFPNRSLSTIKYILIHDASVLDRLSKTYFTEEYEKVKAHLASIKSSAEAREEGSFIKAPESHNPSAIFYEWIFSALQKWQGWAFKSEEFKNPGKISEETISNCRSIVPLMTTTLLKRLESGIQAFIDSISNQITFCKVSIACLATGYLIASTAIEELRKMVTNEDLDVDEDEDPLNYFISEGNLEADEILKSVLEKYLVETKEKTETSTERKKKIKIVKITTSDFSPENLDALKAKIQQDTEVLEKIKKIASDIFALGDFKLQKLKETLSRILKTAKNHNERKTVVFTFFETTARYIRDSLLADQSWMKEAGNPVIGYISGCVADHVRKEVIKKFAPVSSDAMIPETEQFDILISTDVLSEGQNLQDAKQVINYDLHWNPVRMIQRAGRIDRLGCLHKDVTIHNFFLEEGLEAILKLMRRIVTRLRKIDEAIELDVPVIEMETDYKKLSRIQAEDSKIIDEYEEQLDIIGLNRSKKALFAAIQQIGYEKLRRTPLGIYSGMQTLDYSGLMVAVELNRGESKTPTTTWCYDPDDIEKEFPGLKPFQGIIQDKIIIEKIISCGEKKERLVIEPPEDIYKRAANIIRKLGDQIRQKATASTMIERIEKGNKKYYDIVSNAVKKWGLDADFAERFIQFLKEKKLDNIRKDVKDILDKFNKDMDEFDSVAKKMDDDSSLNKPRVEAIEEFLISIYDYFDRVGIIIEDKSKYKEKGKREIKLIGIMRVYTEATLIKLRKT